MKIKNKTKKKNSKEKYMKIHQLGATKKLGTYNELHPSTNCMLKENLGNHIT
jgi:hypothetical protein